jgi:hypothetical protein
MLQGFTEDNGFAASRVKRDQYFAFVKLLGSSRGVYTDHFFPSVLEPFFKFSGAATNGDDFPTVSGFVFVSAPKRDAVSIANGGQLVGAQQPVVLEPMLGDVSIIIPRGVIN